MNLSALYDNYHQRSLSIKQDDNINIFVSNAILLIIEKVFKELASTYVVMTSSRIPAIEYWFQDIMEQVSTVVLSMSVQMLLTNMRKQKKIHLQGKKYCNLIMVDSYQSLT